MGLFLLATRDFASVEIGHLTDPDVVFVFGHGTSSWNDQNRAKLHFVDGSWLSSRQARNGDTVYWCTTHQTLTWPGCQGETLQVFHHHDWPGMYGAVNIDPRFWTQPLVTAEEVIHRGVVLPNCPLGLPS